MRLYLGCSKSYLKDYINVDLTNYLHFDYKHNIKSLPMFEDNSADLIIHSVEYNCAY